MDVKLIFFKPDGTRRDVSLSPGEYVVGRGDQATLRVPLMSISRSHCTLILDEGGLRVRDMSSLNGTFLNDARVQGEAPMEAGDVLRLGDCQITIQVNGVPADVQQPVARSGASSMMDTPGRGAEPAAIEDPADNATRQPGAMDDGSSAFDFDFDFSDKDA